MRTLKLMADYESFPLWEASSGKVGNIDPDSLPLSSSLKSDLMSWARSFDITLNPNDPLASGFQSTQDEEVFKKRGAELADRLRAELGTAFSIVTKF